MTHEELTNNLASTHDLDHESYLTLVYREHWRNQERLNSSLEQRAQTRLVLVTSSARLVLDSIAGTPTGSSGLCVLTLFDSFLVADHVYVASAGAKSEKNPNPTQYVFSSSADDSAFEIYPDPRGNTLGRGTEITLVLKQDALEYLDTQKLAELMYGQYL